MAGIVSVASEARKNLVTSLSHVNDKRMVGIMAACLFDKEASVGEVAAEVLKRLLPQMRASDRQNLSANEMSLLNKALGSKDNALVLALLQAFEQIGDETTLPYVEKLVYNSRTDKIRQAALACLPYLETRAKEAQQAKTLLRPSGVAEATTSDMLLRPAHGVSEEAVEQLLRPG